MKKTTCSQHKAPILDSLLGGADNDKIVQFHVPGHKQGRFFPSELKQILGEDILAIDQPSIDGITDNCFHSAGCIKEAQELAAELYGAAHTRFLVNGSTIGNLTAVMSAVAPGEAILLPRNIHRSIGAALVLSGARPVYLNPPFHPAHGALPISTSEVREAFQRHPELRAVLLTRPTYYGIANDIREMAQICHANNCPLLIDAAHGAHLRFLPEGYITQALDLGADIVVQSCHKTLGSLTGTSQLHIGHDALIDVDHLQLMLNTLQSTSPNYILLASLDATRRMMWQQGQTLFATAVEKAQQLRERIDAIPGVSSTPLSAELIQQGYQADPLRLVVNFDGLNISGFTAAHILDERYGIGWEMCDDHNIVLILSPQDDQAMYDDLLTALHALATESIAIQAKENHKDSVLGQPPLPELILLPREAAFSRKVKVPIEQALGRICGEMLMTYPPGNPILVPGELVSQEIIDFCLQLKGQGADIYATDSSLESLIVVSNEN